MRHISSVTLSCCNTGQGHFCVLSTAHKPKRSCLAEAEIYIFHAAAMVAVDYHKSVPAKPYAGCKCRKLEVRQVSFSAAFDGSALHASAHYLVLFAAFAECSVPVVEPAAVYHISGATAHKFQLAGPDVYPVSVIALNIYISGAVIERASARVMSEHSPEEGE